MKKETESVGEMPHSYPIVSKPPSSVLPSTLPRLNVPITQSAGMGATGSPARGQGCGSKETRRSWLETEKKTAVRFRFKNEKITCNLC